MKPLGRKGAATRQAILESARAAFVKTGYDAGVREIAENAGVTAMLVKHYFGSKEQLFEEVVEATLSTPGVLTRENLEEVPDIGRFCRHIAQALVARTAPGATPMDGFLILLRSAHDEQATAILRRKFDTHFATPLTGLLSGEGRPQRAALLLSVMAGFQVMRQIIGMNGLVEAGEEHLARLLEPLFSILVGEQTR
ncbi:TetR/AcrR family transcriptional regulator [Burkholderia gladioli]|uniref:TetR/AcrR family transcriptional regulator n=1 Tax=Burkholderia gladioli TaxID=28095 RepID=UPI00163EC49C|nr:TetR/AcrR family transcriptional regulator [Burkholderia gladioli]